VAATPAWRLQREGASGVGEGRCGLRRRSMPRPAAALGCVLGAAARGGNELGVVD